MYLNYLIYIEYLKGFVLEDKIKISKGKMVAIHLKLSEAEKEKLQVMANNQTNGNITSLIKLFANGNIRK